MIKKIENKIDKEKCISPKIAIKNENKKIIYNINNRRKYNINTETNNSNQKREPLININNNSNNNNNENYIDDNSYNLNINEIINQKNKEIPKLTIEDSNLKPNINHYKTIDNENEERNERFRKRKLKSSSDIRANLINNEPKYCNLFDNINIFNSVLIILNNNLFINDFFSQNKRIEEIKECEKNNKYCLISILYNLNNYLWNYDNFFNIDELFKKYKEFVDCYLENNCNNLNKEKYLYDYKNIEIIISFMYRKINKEFSGVNKLTINSKIIKGNDVLSIFLKEFFNKNNSIISHNFVGFYENLVLCDYCQRKNNMYNMSYSPEYQYFPFFYINFNLNEINFQINSKILNLDICFNYDMLKKYNIHYKIYCNSCLTTYKRQKLSIYSFPNILTILLSNNDNYNFVLQDEINLKNYSLKSCDDDIYCLVSILCKINYNGKYILYSINPKNEKWYSYVNGKIFKVETIDINAIPLVLIYQKRSSIKFEYNGLKKEDKKTLNVNFMNGIPSQKLFFSPKSLVINAKRQISEFCNIQIDKIILLVNGQKPDDYKLLNNVIKNENNTILVLIQ